MTLEEMKRLEANRIGGQVMRPRGAVSEAEAEAATPTLDPGVLKAFQKDVADFNDRYKNRRSILSRSQRERVLQERADLELRGAQMGIGVSGPDRTGIRSRMELSPGGLAKAMAATETPEPEVAKPSTTPASNAPVFAPGLGGLNLAELSTGLGEDPMDIMNLAGGGKVDPRLGPKGTDTIPAVVGGKGLVMLDGGEYVLPEDTTKKVGVKKLNRLVDETHGMADGGWLGGMFKGVPRNRAKQIDEAVDAAVAPPPVAKPAPVEEPVSDSKRMMAEIMRKMREKNPPAKYADGGKIYSPRKRAEELGLRYAAEQNRQLMEQERGFLYPDLVQLPGGIPAKLENAQASKDYYAAHPTTPGRPPGYLSRPSFTPPTKEEVPVSTPEPAPKATPALLQDRAQPTGSPWAYVSKGGEMTAMHPQGDVAIRPGTGRGGASPAGFDAQTMQDVAGRIARGETGGGTMSVVSGPGRGNMPQAEWDALPNSEKIKRNVDAINAQTAAVRATRNAQRNAQDLPDVGANRQTPLKPSEMLAYAGLQERAMNNAAQREIGQGNLEVNRGEARTRADKENREAMAQYQESLAVNPTFGMVPREQVAGTIATVAKNTGVPMLDVQQELEKLIYGSDFGLDKYKQSPENYQNWLSIEKTLLDRVRAQMK